MSHGTVKRVRELACSHAREFGRFPTGRLPQLSVWWIKLGITPELIEPAHPQQTGRHERMHRTLKAETTRPVAQSARAQQRRFTACRHEVNAERPHEALNGDTPGSYWHRSARRCPVGRPPDPEYPAHFEVRHVSRNGGVRWHNRWVNVSQRARRGVRRARGSRGRDRERVLRARPPRAVRRTRWPDPWCAQPEQAVT